MQHNQELKKKILEAQKGISNKTLSDILLLSEIISKYQCKKEVCIPNLGDILYFVDSYHNGIHNIAKYNNTYLEAICRNFTYLDKSLEEQNIVDIEFILDILKPFLEEYCLNCFSKFDPKEKIVQDAYCKNCYKIIKQLNVQLTQILKTI